MASKENATIVIVPSTAVESMQLGGLAGLTALTMGLGQDGKGKPQDAPESQPNGTADSEPVTPRVLVS